jgi:hypothetical protein
MRIPLTVASEQCATVLSLIQPGSSIYINRQEVPPCRSEPFAEFILERSEGLEGKLREESRVSNSRC